MCFLFCFSSNFIFWCFWKKIVIGVLSAILFLYYYQYDDSDKVITTSVLVVIFLLKLMLNAYINFYHGFVIVTTISMVIVQYCLCCYQSWLWIEFLTIITFIVKVILSRHSRRNKYQINMASRGRGRGRERGYQSGGVEGDRWENGGGWTSGWRQFDGRKEAKFTPAERAHVPPPPPRPPSPSPSHPGPKYTPPPPP